MALQEWASHVRQLQLFGCSLLRNDHRFLFESLTQLHSLELEAGPHLRSPCIKSITCLQNLRQLTFNVDDPPSSTYVYLTSLANLTRLDTSLWQDEIANLTQPEELRFHTCIDVDDPPDRYRHMHISQMSRLRHLQMSPRQSRFLSVVKGLPAFISLHLEHDPGRQFRTLMELTGLKRLATDFADIEWQSINKWAQMTGLERLAISTIENSGTLGRSTFQQLTSLLDLATPVRCVSASPSP